jgi:hypothetical protein
MVVQDEDKGFDKARGDETHPSGDAEQDQQHRDASAYAQTPGDRAAPEQAAEWDGASAQAVHGSASDRDEAERDQEWGGVRYEEEDALHQAGGESDDRAYREEHVPPLVRDIRPCMARRKIAL